MWIGLGDERGGGGGGVGVSDITKQMRTVQIPQSINEAICILIT